MRSNFHKRNKWFEAKKAMNYELEAHSHRGLEEEDEDGEENRDGCVGEGGRNYEGKKRKEW